MLSNDNQDQAIQQAAEAWLEELSKLWTAVGKTPTLEQLKVYQDMLGDVPLGLLERSVKRALQAHKFNSVPTIGNVWDAFLIELDAPDGMPIREAIERWEARLWGNTVVYFAKVGMQEVPA